MIQAIETIYKGYKFRSRLEARWAVFFDSMGIEYEYESEGFQREWGEETVRYLPDFYFPEWEMYGEVKGTNVRGKIPEKDAERMSIMIDYDGPCSNGIIMFGDIPYSECPDYLELATWRWHGKGLEWIYGYYDGDKIFWSESEIIDYQEAPHYFDKNDDLMLTHLCSLDDDYSVFANSKLKNALIKARQARFEHGETPGAKVIWRTMTY